MPLMLSYKEWIVMFFDAASSSEIRNALKDESLQKLISSIDCSPDPECVSNLISTWLRGIYHAEFCCYFWIGTW